VFDPKSRPGLSFRSPISRRAFVKRGAAVAGAATLTGPAAALGRRRGVATAETAIVGGRVLSLAGSAARATAVAIAGGKLIAVGSDAEVQATAGPQTEVIDAGGATVIPGIHDGHSHPFSGGQQLTAPTLKYAILDLEQFVNRIKRLLANSTDREPDGWLKVSLWDATSMDKLPTKADLDQLPTQRPVIVVSLDGHIALANSRALTLAGITGATSDPPGGEIRRGPGNEPTGILLDNAIGLVTSLIPPPTPEQNADALAAGYELMAEAGITTCLHASVSETELAALAALSDRGPLPLRPHLALRVDAAEAADPAAMLARVEALRSTYGRPQITIDHLKMFFDGVIEYPTQTAALLKPYLVNTGSDNDPHWVPGKDRGPTYWPPAIARAAITAADAAGWQVHVHAIGDRATRSALDAFEAAIAANGRSDHRHTIAHLELVDPADFPRFARLGVLASMQMQWAERDSYTVDRLRDYLGPKRYRNVYPSGSLRKAGALLCGGSDWPVDPLLPFRQIEMAVNRTADEVYAGDPKPLFKNQGIRLRAAIAMHTRNGAFQLHQEGFSGRLVAGMAADLVVADRDLLAVPLRKVSRTKALLTMVGGRIVHRSTGI
jgi:predicted amidohydrolase YtcJ